MNANRRTARAVGGAFIIGTVAGILSRVVTGPIQNAQDPLMSVPGSDTRLVVGALLVLMMGLALAMVPVIMFPILSLRFKRGDFAMSFMYIAKPPAFVLLAYSGSLFDRRIAFRSA
jgi:hypothetical protein